MAKIFEANEALIIKELYKLHFKGKDQSPEDPVWRSVIVNKPRHMARRTSQDLDSIDSSKELKSVGDEKVSEIGTALTLAKKDRTYESRSNLRKTDGEIRSPAPNVETYSKRLDSNIKYV